MADQSMLAKAEKYLDLFEEIRKRTGDAGLAETILVEAARDRRIEQMKEERAIRNSEPATVRQLQFLESLRVDHEPGITKRQASMLIDEAVDAGEEAAGEED